MTTTTLSVSYEELTAKKVHTRGTRLLDRASWFGLLLVLLLLAVAKPSYALQGATQCHDPSTIVKSGNTYWIFTTGDGIYSMSSTDLVNWTPGPRPVFPLGTWPSWINARVPGFAGNFWAPECKFMNGKYYLYYSCSTFGSRVSAIGLATNVTLDPSSPNYQWVDEGEVISTSSTSTVNAIDPALFEAADGTLWLTYGSFFGGIRATQLNPTTGKLLGTSQFALANGGVEAAYIIRNGTYYYLFINRGACCQGINSTYNVLVGRSTSPSGPYLDKNGVSLNNGGGTSVLSTSGRYIGPGQVGIFQENGVSYVSHHYYDGFENGTPRLSLANLQWDAAQWPILSRDWVASGRYQITSSNSPLVWDAWGCTGTAGQPIAQGTNANLTCQQWDFTSLGNGEYKITNALGGLAAEVMNCSPYLGAKLQLSPYTGQLCQQFKLDRANDGSLVMASVNGNRVVEVPNASQAAGMILGLWDYNGCLCQRWRLGSPITLGNKASELAGVSVYPVPSTDGNFMVQMNGGSSEPVTVEVLSQQGQVVYTQSFVHKPTLSVAAGLQPGMYVARIKHGREVLTQKLTVQ